MFEASMPTRFEILPLAHIQGGGYLFEFPDYIADAFTPEDAVAEGRDALKS